MAQRPSAVMRRRKYQLNFPEAGGDVFVCRGAERRSRKGEVRIITQRQRQHAGKGLTYKMSSSTVMGRLLVGRLLGQTFAGCDRKAYCRQYRHKRFSGWKASCRSRLLFAGTVRG